MAGPRRRATEQVPAVPRLPVAEAEVALGTEVKVASVATTTTTVQILQRAMAGPSMMTCECYVPFGRKMHLKLRDAFVCMLYAKY